MNNELTNEDLSHLGWSVKDLDDGELQVKGQRYVLYLNDVEIARAWDEDAVWAQARRIEGARNRPPAWAKDWSGSFDERQQKEIRFAMLYSQEFAHGTDGHHRLLLIAKLAGMLDGLTQIYKERGINDGNLSD